MTDSSEKKVHKEISGDSKLDRLSALPDCILLYILSLIPVTYSAKESTTREAAATSILSRRWRNLFILLPDVELSFRVRTDASDRDRLFDSFMHFANRVIRHRNEAVIREIRLNIMHFVERDKLAFESWLASAAAAMPLFNVQLFWVWVQIDADYLIDDISLSISIPPSIFTCKILSSLTLDLEMDWILPDFVCLPNLKGLFLRKCRLVNEESIRRLLQGCPLLEQLLFYFRLSNSDSGTQGVKVLDFSCPSLKSMMLCCREEFDFDITVIVKSKNLDCFLANLKGPTKVTIDAPNLKSLSIKGGRYLKINIIQNLVSIDEADVNAGFLHNLITESDKLLRAQHAFEFISGLQNVKSLHLSESDLKALYFHKQAFPTFRNLIKLHFTTFYSRGFPWISMSEVLSRVFESLCNLEVLFFDGVFNHYFSEDEEFDSAFPDAFPLSFIEHLKEIYFTDFKVKEHDIKVVEYFLKNGKSLKKMILVREAWEDLSEVCYRISTFKKCAEDCQIVFIKTWDWFMRPCSERC